MKPILFALMSLALMVPSVSRAADANAESTTTAVKSTPTATPQNDPVIAQGKGFEIRQSAMDQVLATAKAQNPQDDLPSDAQVHVINQLIEIQLVLQKATDAEKADGRKKTDEKLAAIVKSMSPTEFARRLNATHMTADDLHLMLYQEDTAQTSLVRQLGIKITDADAKKFFDDHPGAYDQPVIARIREILLLTTSDFTTSAAPPLPDATIQAKHKLIDELHQRLQAGEDFAALAKQYNEDPVSKDTGGVLSFVKEQMEFGEVAFSLKPGQISAVLKNDEGYRIIQLLEIVPAKKATFPELDDRLKTMLTSKETKERAPAYIKQLRKDAEVEILDPKLKEAVAAAEADEAKAAKTQAEFAAKQAAEEAKAASAATTSAP